VASSLESEGDGVVSRSAAAEGAPAAPAVSQSLTQPVRIVQYGLGPIGQAIARLAARRSSIQIVGAVDVDPTKAGQSLSAVLGGDADLAVLDSVTVEPTAERLLREVRPQVVLHSTLSSLTSVQPQLEELLRGGAHVISTCEELSFPAAADPAAARALDAIARENGVSLLGTGVNPGFVMDTLPVALSAVCQNVRSVGVVRVVDAAKRRLPLQRKIGAGLRLEEFQERVRAGTVRHVGLRESAALVAAAFGWTIERYEETVEPKIAGRSVSSAEIQVGEGQAAGVVQAGRAYAGGRLVVSLDLEMSLQAENPRDEVRIDGTPPLRVVIDGGVHGDTATAAVVVNAIPRVLAVPPGLCTMLDLAVVHSIAAAT
jgi:4-hydroxy-tetrahydrodipicolinate reductase